MIRAFFALLARDLRLATRRRFDLLQPLFFTLLVCLLTTLAIGPEPALLARLAAAVTWIAVLLALLLALDGLFRPDAEDGSLELLLTAPAPLPVLVMAMPFAFWLLVLLPLILCAPLFSWFRPIPGSVKPAPGGISCVWGMLCVACFPRKAAPGCRPLPVRMAGGGAQACIMKSGSTLAGLVSPPAGGGAAVGELLSESASVPGAGYMASSAFVVKNLPGSDLCRPSGREEGNVWGD